MRYSDWDSLDDAALLRFGLSQDLIPDQSYEKESAARPHSPQERNTEPLEVTSSDCTYSTSMPTHDLEQFIAIQGQTGVEEVIRSTKAMRDLPRTMTTNSEQWQIEAIGTFETLKSQASLELLISALSDSSWKVRAAAARALGRLGNYTPIDFLVVALQKEQDQNVRGALVRALGKQKGNIPIDILVPILYDDISWLVREAAAWALGQAGRSAPFDDLVEALEGDANASVRAAAAQALGLTGRLAAEKCLLNVLSGNEAEEKVRSAAVNAVSRLASSLDREGPHNQSAAEVQRTQTFLALTGFLHNKRGHVKKLEFWYNEHEMVIQVACSYEESSGRTLQEAVLGKIRKSYNSPKVKSIQTALGSRDYVVQEATKQAIKDWGNRPWQELLVVSFVVPSELPQSNPGESEEALPIRVVVTGMSYQHVPKKDQLVLREIGSVWTKATQERLICEHPHHVTDLQIWYQPTMDNAQYSSII